MKSVLMILSILVAAASTVMVGHFSAGDLTGWETQTFAGETRYRLQEKDGRQGLYAQSQDSASGLYREITVDLEQTPYLNWSWRVANVLQGLDERKKSGDDFPARVYVVVSGGALFWKTRSVVYVWSNNQPVGSTWKNPYTGNARMLAVRSGPQRTGQWIAEKRNVRLDFKELFGEAGERIDAVAIMTDTDDSGQSAQAWYGDIFFSTD